MRRISVPSSAVSILEILVIVCLAAAAALGLAAVVISDVTWPFKILTAVLLLIWVFMGIAATALQTPRHPFAKEPKDAHWTPDPIIAYRYTIQPIGVRVYEGQIPATCRVEETHRAPTWHCTCGYYAFKSREIAEGYDKAMGPHRPSGLLLCLLWGRVIETELGYRAEHMAPVAWVGDWAGAYIIVHPSALNAPHLPAIDIHDTEAIEHAINQTINNLDIEQYRPYDRRRNGHRKTRSQD